MLFIMEGPSKIGTRQIHVVDSRSRLPKIYTIGRPASNMNPSARVCRTRADARV